MLILILEGVLHSAYCLIIDWISTTFEIGSKLSPFLKRSCHFKLAALSPQKLKKILSIKNSVDCLLSSLGEASNICILVSYLHNDHVNVKSLTHYITEWNKSTYTWLQESGRVILIIGLTSQLFGNVADIPELFYYYLWLRQRIPVDFFFNSGPYIICCATLF